MNTFWDLSEHASTGSNYKTYPNHMAVESLKASAQVRQQTFDDSIETCALATCIQGDDILSASDILPLCLYYRLVVDEPGLDAPVVLVRWPLKTRHLTCLQ